MPSSYSVELPVAGAQHERVGRQGTRYVEAGTLRLFNRRRDDRLFFIAEQAVFAGVGVERTHGQSRPPDAELPHGAVG
jgi:hypothetical protein